MADSTPGWAAHRSQLTDLPSAVPTSPPPFPSVAQSFRLYQGNFRAQNYFCLEQRFFIHGVPLSILQLSQLWEEYGSVYTLYFGSNPAVFICGYEAVKEALIDQNDDFGARGKVPTMDQFTKGYGLTFSNGERWKAMRHFTMKTFKDFGFGKKSIEWKIQEEVRCVMEEFRRSQGHPWNPTKIFMQASSNILCLIVFGERYDYSDARFAKLLHSVEEIFRLMSCNWGQAQNILPTLMSYIPGPHRHVITISEEMVEFIAEMAKSCQETLDSNDPRHFTDCFLIKIEKEKNNPNTEYNMNNLLHVIYNLFLAATETITTTLRHALLICLKYPDIEAKLREEVDRVIGRDRMPNMEDRLNMPFMQAVMYEVQRFSDIGPINLTHMVTKDTTFRGYYIPKGTDVYPLLCTVHRDPTQFATPYKFNPSHFMDENGKFKKNDACMPFSAGKRMCPGDHVARMEIFIFLSTILQNFTLSSDRQFTEAEVAPKLAGFFNAPIQYELSFNSR
ncbi:cytochrome P450 2F2-like [Gastrophryne carolinensis]